MPGIDVVEVVDQVAPRVEVVVLDRQIVKGVENEAGRALVEVQHVGTLAGDLDPVQRPRAARLDLNVGHELVERFGLLDPDHQIPSPASGLLHPDLRTQPRESRALQPLIDEAGEAAARDLLGDLERVMLSPQVFVDALVCLGHSA